MQSVPNIIFVSNVIVTDLKDGLSVAQHIKKITKYEMEITLVF